MNQGISNKIFEKLFDKVYGRRITKRIKGLEELIRSQDQKGLDLYDGLDDVDRENLISIKNDLVSHLVRKARIGGYKKTRTEASSKFSSYTERLRVKADYFCGKSILEVGSGNSAALADCGASELVNVDPLMNTYLKFVNGFHKLFPDIVFIHSGAESLPFSDNRFQLVVCVNALDHFNDAQESVMEMARVLMIGGKLLLNVDTKDRNNVRLRKRVGHPYSFTQSKLQDLFEGTGMELVYERTLEQGSSHTMHFVKITNQ